MSGIVVDNAEFAIPIRRALGEGPSATVTVVLLMLSRPGSAADAAVVRWLLVPFAISMTMLATTLLPFASPLWFTPLAACAAALTLSIWRFEALQDG
jgi:hypothetical protein